METVPNLIEFAVVNGEHMPVYTYLLCDSEKKGEEIKWAA